MPQDVYTASPDVLKALCPRAIPEVLQHLAPACLEFGIDNAERLSSFLAQVHHESLGLSRLEESFNYRTASRLIAVYGDRVRPTEFAASLIKYGPEAIANHVYANRLGNGDSFSGDGWRYRGRGLMMITGFINYRLRGRALGVDLVADPDEAAKPQTACRSAAEYWASNGCNELADRKDIVAIRRVINGPRKFGLEECTALWKRFRVVLVNGGKTK